jgi:predicted metalloprotease with PDZ domain
LILYNKQRLENKPHGSQRGRAETNQSRLGKRVLHEFKHKVNSKATRGNLMNLLDLAKSNRADN